MNNNLKIILFIMILIEIFLSCSKKNDIQLQGKKEITVVLTNVGYNPIFYSIENKKVPMPEDIEVKLVPTNYSQAELYTLSANKPIIGILSNVNIGKAYNAGLKYKILASYYREGLGPDGKTMGQLIVKKNSSINYKKKK